MLDIEPELSSQDPFLSKQAQSILVSVGVIHLNLKPSPSPSPSPISASASASASASQSFLSLSPNEIESLSHLFSVQSSRAQPSTSFFSKLATLVSCNFIRVSASPFTLFQALLQSSRFPLRIHAVDRNDTLSKVLETLGAGDDQEWQKAGLLTSDKKFKPLFFYPRAVHFFPRSAAAAAIVKEAFLEILQVTRIDQAAWNASFVGEEASIEGGGPEEKYFFDESQGINSLQRIYHQLPSPTPDEALLASAPTWIQDLLASALNSNGPPGLRSSLHPYQKRTLWKLLQKELAPQTVEDPLLIPLQSPHDSSKYFIDPRSLKISRSNSTHHREVKGGILSEMMGTGKTIISLALILATKGQLPDIQDTEQSSLTISNVTSEVSQTFPGEDGGADPARFLLSEGLASLPYYSTESIPHVQGQGQVQGLGLGQDQDQDAPSTRTTLPRLVDLCAHSIRTSKAPIDYLDFLSKHSVPPTLRTLLSSRATPFFNLWPDLPTRTSRAPLDRSPIRIYLSPATLVVVPLTLLRQWRTQISEHCHEDSLRVLFLENSSDSIPSARELAEKWDLILLSHTRFGKERSDGKLHRQWSQVPRKCRCPYWKSTRIVNCSCPPIPKKGKPEISPLLQCRFKRLIVDEGDVLKGNSGLVDLAIAISSDSKWLVSGTPVESLVGSSESSLRQEETTQEPGQISASPSGSRVRTWSNLERKDLDRLKKLLVSFLKLPPFHSSPGADTSRVRDWSSVVSMPLIGSSSLVRAPEWGACTRLSSIMDRVIVRNRIEDVEKDCPLPAIHFQVQRLSFSKIERLTFNSLNALITLNAVWTQREDEDYFFHSANRKHLLGIMENIALACFHFAGVELIPQLTEAAVHARKQLEKPKWSASERSEAEEALLQIEDALQSAEWKKHIETGDVTYSIEDLDRQIIQAWSRKYGERSGLSGDEILRMRRAMSKILGKQKSQSLDEEFLSEELITAGALDLRRFRDSEAKISSKKRKIPDISAADSSKSLGLIPSPTKKVKSSHGSQLQSKQVAAILSGESTASPLSAVPKRASRDLALVDSGARLPSSIPLSKARLSGVSSSKLKFLLEQLQSIPAGDKVLVFSGHDNVLFEVGNALELSQISHLILASGVAQSRRNEFVAAFSSPNSSVKVLLMKTSITSKGLDLGSANRVYFLDPIFDSSLELQALKRAYRLGQKKEVFVTRIVMQDTFEDEMLKRRQELEAHSSSSESSDQAKAGAWNDERMRHFISHPQFVKGDKDGKDFGVSHAALSSPIDVFLVARDNTGDCEGSSNHNQRASTSTIPLSPPLSPYTSLSSGTSDSKAPQMLLPLNTPPDIPPKVQRPTSPTPNSSLVQSSSTSSPPKKKKVKFDA